MTLAHSRPSQTNPPRRATPTTPRPTPAVDPSQWASSDRRRSSKSSRFRIPSNTLFPTRPGQSPDTDRPPRREPPDRSQVGSRPRTPGTTPRRTPTGPTWHRKATFFDPQNARNGVKMTLFRVEIAQKPSEFGQIPGDSGPLCDTNQKSGNCSGWVGAEDQQD